MHNLVPRVLSFSNMAAVGKRENPGDELVICLIYHPSSLFQAFRWRSPLSERLEQAIILVGITFLDVNNLARPAESSRSRRDNQSIRQRCCQLLARAKRSKIFAYKHSLKATRLGGRPSVIPGTTFLDINGA